MWLPSIPLLHKTMLSERSTVSIQHESILKSDAALKTVSISVSGKTADDVRCKLPPHREHPCRSHEFSSAFFACPDTSTLIHVCYDLAPPLFQRYFDHVYQLKSVKNQSGSRFRLSSLDSRQQRSTQYMYQQHSPRLVVLTSPFTAHQLIGLS